MLLTVLPSNKHSNGLNPPSVGRIAGEHPSRGCQGQLATDRATAYQREGIYYSWQYYDGGGGQVGRSTVCLAGAYARHEHARRSAQIDSLVWIFEKHIVVGAALGQYRYISDQYMIKNSLPFSE